MTTTTEVFALARLLSAALVQKTRDNGDTFYALADGSPEWMTDAIRAAHGDRLPDDTIYGVCKEVADALADADESQDPRDVLLDIEPDIYTSGLTAWLAAHIDHVADCDEYAEEYGEGVSVDLVNLMQGGQLVQIRRVGGALIDVLEETANG